jgi:hypothetical protein
MLRRLYYKILTALFILTSNIFPAIGEEWEKRPPEEGFYNSIPYHTPYEKLSLKVMSPVNKDKQEWAKSKLSDRAYFEITREEAVNVAPYNFVINDNLRYFIVRALGIPHRGNVDYEVFYFDNSLVVTTFILGHGSVSKVAMIVALPEPPERVYIWAGGAL